MHTKTLPFGQPVLDRRESSQLLDRDFDAITEEEAAALMRAFFGRAESLKPMMLK